MRRLILCCLLLLWSSAEAETIAFVGGNVISPQDGRTHSGATVLIDSGKIVAVGSRIRIPKDARRIDARGKFLMPGLSDMHVHLLPMDMDDQLFLYLANGVTTIRVMAGTPRALALRNEIASGSRLGPRMQVATPLLTDAPRPAGFVSVVTSVDEIRSRIAEFAVAGYDIVKLHNISDQAIYLAGIEAARKAGLRVIGHVPKTLGASRAISAGLNGIEHFAGYMPVVDAELNELTARSGIWNTPTLIVLWTNLHQEEILQSPFAETKYLPPILARGALGRRAKAPEAIDVAGFQRVLADLVARDARVLTGTDTGTLMLVPGFSLHREFDLWSQADIGPARILRASTVASAEWVDGSSVDGGIVPGARADLVLLDADPLRDIANARRIVGVMTCGRYLDRSEIDARLKAIESRNPKRKAQ